MVGDIKAISPCVKSASAKLFLDLHTVSAPSGEERTLNAAAQVERDARCCRRLHSDTRARCGSVTVMVLVSSDSAPSVRGCIRAPRYFHPYPVPRSQTESSKWSPDFHTTPPVGRPRTQRANMGVKIQNTAFDKPKYSCRQSMSTASFTNHSQINLVWSPGEHCHSPASRCTAPWRRTDRHGS